jgi:phage terminase large subunit
MKAIQKDEKKPNDAANEPHELTHLPDSLRAFCAGRPLPPILPTVRDPDSPRSYTEQIEDFMDWGT